eukprot:Sdes_comp19973_c0_seq3m12540
MSEIEDLDQSQSEDKEDEEEEDEDEEDDEEDEDEEDEDDENKEENENEKKKKKEDNKVVIKENEIEAKEKITSFSNEEKSFSWKENLVNKIIHIFKFTTGHSAVNPTPSEESYFHKILEADYSLESLATQNKAQNNYLGEESLDHDPFANDYAYNSAMAVRKTFLSKIPTSTSDHQNQPQNPSQPNQPSAVADHIWDSSRASLASHGSIYDLEDVVLEDRTAILVDQPANNKVLSSAGVNTVSTIQVVENRQNEGAEGGARDEKASYSLLIPMVASLGERVGESGGNYKMIERGSKIDRNLQNLTQGKAETIITVYFEPSDRFQTFVLTLLRGLSGESLANYKRKIQESGYTLKRFQRFFQKELSAMEILNMTDLYERDLHFHGRQFISDKSSEFKALSMLGIAAYTGGTSTQARASRWYLPYFVMILSRFEDVPIRFLTRIIMTTTCILKFCTVAQNNAGNFGILIELC